VSRRIWLADRVVGALIGHDEAVYRRLQKRGRILLGEGTYGIPTILESDYDNSRLIVGKYASLGGIFFLGGYHAVDRVTTYPHRILWNMEGAGVDGFPDIHGDIHVGSDCYIGRFSIIMGGLTIGDGAVVAAGAVVTKDVPPYAIVGGTPARVIRYRVSEEQREALLQIRWWDWPRERVRQAVPLLADSDIDAFIAWATERGLVASPTAD
jgi:hypothetical protein